MDRAKPSLARAKIEFGDFQTPRELADRIARLLQRRCVRPKTILEPTCGQGNLLLAAADAFPAAERVVGVDINEDYLRDLKRVVRQRDDKGRFHLRCRNVLSDETQSSLFDGCDPWLVIGNPPWVTNSAVGAIRGANLPAKSNSSGAKGIEALTGQSNFDVSEWILRQLVSWFDGRRATFAMLCKTSVARKTLAFIWQNGLRTISATVYAIDAAREFSAAVDACLFLCEFGETTKCFEADVYSSLESDEVISRIGWRNNLVIADVQRFDRWQHLQAIESKNKPLWRSGVKHDCAEILELERHDGKYKNRVGDLVELETQHVYPLMKSADLARETSHEPRRWLLIPQNRLNDDPARIAERAPRTWQYLQQHAERFDRRRSRIYRNRAPFSVFGVGDYTFAPWKVAVSGFYKRLNFKAIGPCCRRPTVFDDTCYFLPCRNRAQAEQICAALNGEIAREFFSSLIFWDTKRPITAKLLRQLDIERLLALV